MHAVSAHLLCKLDIVVEHEGDVVGSADVPEFERKLLRLLDGGLLLAELDEGSASCNGILDTGGKRPSPEPGSICHGIAEHALPDVRG